MVDRIRAVLANQGRLSMDVDQVADRASLYEAGMTSHASVNVMLGLEDEFDVEFPDQMLRRDVFESIASIEAALIELQKETVS
jgi:acyl carrier protein